MLHMCFYMHSHFIWNHLVRILEDRPLISVVVLSQHLGSSYCQLSLFLLYFSYLRIHTFLLVFGSE
jgi:hypothetical protein